MEDVEKIKEHINILIRQNENLCNINNCNPSPYMEGSNRAYRDILDYIGSSEVRKKRKEYDLYMELVNKQLKNAIEQSQKIPELVKTSNMTYEDWCKWQNKK